MNVPPAARIELLLIGAAPATAARLAEYGPMIAAMARLSTACTGDGPAPKGAVQGVIDEATLALPIADVIDIDQERTRLAKDIAKLDGEIRKISKKLNNHGFLAKAPEAVVAENRDRLAEETRKRDQLSAAMERLAAL